MPLVISLIRSREAFERIDRFAVLCAFALTSEVLKRVRRWGACQLDSAMAGETFSC